MTKRGCKASGDIRKHVTAAILTRRTYPWENSEQIHQLLPSNYMRKRTKNQRWCEGINSRSLRGWKGLELKWKAKWDKLCYGRFVQGSLLLCHIITFFLPTEKTRSWQTYLILKHVCQPHTNPLPSFPLFAYFHETLLFSDHKAHSTSPYSLQGRTLPPCLWIHRENGTFHLMQFLQ